MALVEGSGTLAVAATTASYSTANTVDWATGALKQKSIIVSNTGAESITLRLRARVYESGVWHTLQEGTLNASTSTIINLDHWYHEIDIAVKDGSGHSAVTIDYGGYRI